MTKPIDLSRFANLDLTTHDDGVWVVTLNRPQKRNALDLDTIDELVDFSLPRRAPGSRRWCWPEPGIISAPGLI